MKKIMLLTVAFMMAMGLFSCGKSEESQLVGRWGLLRLEYYHTDFYGQPIESTIEAEEFVPGDMENGVELVFYANKHGEWIDRDLDTFLVQISINPVMYDTIINPDTVVVTNFTYSYDQDLSALYLRTSLAETFQLSIETLNDNTFIYTNEYKQNVVERAVLRRIDSKSQEKSSGKTSKRITRPEGSFARKMSVNE